MLWNEINEFIPLVRNGELSLKSFIAFYDSYFKDSLYKLEKQYNQKSLRIIIAQVFDSRIEKAGKAIDRMYDEYTEQCHKGVPYCERVKIISQEKIDKVNQYILDLKENKKKFEVVPIGEYIQFGDYETMKRIGIRAFIDYHFKDTWFIPSAF